MRKRELKNMEWGILITAIILCIIGIVSTPSWTIVIAKNSAWLRKIENIYMGRWTI